MRIVEWFRKLLTSRDIETIPLDGPSPDQSLPEISSIEMSAARVVQAARVARISAMRFRKANDSLVSTATEITNPPMIVASIKRSA